MRESNYVLVVQSMVGVLLCARALGQPSTQSSVTLAAANAMSYSQSAPSQASGSVYQDDSQDFDMWGGTAQADSAFGYNSASATVSYSYETTYGVARSLQPQTSAAYTLTWSTADNSQSGSIISVEAGLGETINGLYTGEFSFVYGTTYNIEGSLGVNASNASWSSAAASSLWDDTITFLGQPDGAMGDATFTVLLNGSITQQQSQYSSYNGFYHYDQSEIIGDFSGGAELSSIVLPERTSILAASGTLYPVSETFAPAFIPEPGPASLLGLGLGGLWLYRSKSKTWAAPQICHSKSRSRPGDQKSGAAR